MMFCDYCKQLAVCKVTIHNHYWILCLDCAKKNKDRFMITDKDLERIEKDDDILGGIFTDVPMPRTKEGGGHSSQA